MAWEVEDVIRSLRRYLAMTMETPPWRLRVERREVRDDDRPVGVVVAGPKTSQRARTSLIQGNVEDLLPITITLYPPVVSATDGDAIRETRLLATQLADQIQSLFDTGLTITTEPEKGQVRHWAGPFRAPLWDYADVPLTGPDKAGPEEPHDVLWVVESSLSSQPIQDPDDPGRWSVVTNLRVSIERPGRVPPDDEIVDVKALEGEYIGEGHIP